MCVVAHIAQTNFLALSVARFKVPKIARFGNTWQDLECQILPDLEVLISHQMWQELG